LSYTSFGQNNQSFYTDTSYVIVADIKIIGNKTTKPGVIVRELLFQKGDTIYKNLLSSIIETSNNNIYNTSLFIENNINIAYINQKHIQVIVTVKERWYLWPGLIFKIEDTNFNTWWLTKDWQRLNYGFYVRHDNFRGRKEKLAIIVQNGYTEQFGILYENPYVNKNKTIGLGSSFNYLRNHQITINTQNNKRVFYREFPEYPFKEVKAELALTYRPKINNRHNIKLEYVDILLSDSVINTNPNYLTQSLTTRFMGVHYYYKSDFRDNQNYPLKGYYFDIEAAWHGLGIWNKNVNNGFLLSQLKYFLPLNKRFYFSQGFRAKTTFNNPGYYFLSSLGYGNIVVRGYEYYVITGQHYGLFKTQLRYNIIKPSKVKLPVNILDKFSTIPFAFYVGLYFDNGYVWDNGLMNNSLANQWLYGGGLSVDFVTYYDFVLRTEFSVNKHNQTGIYLHFVAPI
jgi:outer membrane protein assembly factor BamA